MNAPDETGQGVLELPEFMMRAQSVVDSIPRGFRGQKGKAFVMLDSDTNENPLDTYTDPQGTVYVRAEQNVGMLVPANIDEARGLAAKGRIVLTPALSESCLHIAFDQQQFQVPTDRNLAKPFLVIDYVDVGIRRIVTGARCFYGTHRHSYIPIDNLIGAAVSNPEVSTATERSMFAGQVRLPLNAGQYMAESQTLLNAAFDGIAAEQFGQLDRPTQARNTVNGIIDVDKEGLHVLLRDYGERIRTAAKTDAPHAQLARTRGNPSAENARQTLFQNLLYQAERNTGEYYIQPYTFDEVVACVDQAALSEALEKIPNPYFHVIKTKEGAVLRVSGSRSTPETLGMTYREAADYASVEELTLSPKDHAHFNNRDEPDAWIQGGLASGRIPHTELYRHPEIGAHLSKQIPMDTKKLGVFGNAQVIGRSILSIFRR